MPLTASMTFGAESNEIGKVIGLFVPLCSEVSESDQMMHVQGLTKFIRAFAAILTDLIALATQTALSFPTSSIVRGGAAAPIRMRIPSDIDGDPFSKTFSRAEPATGCLWSCLECLSASFAACFKGSWSKVSDVSDSGLSRTESGAVNSWPSFIPGKVYLANGARRGNASPGILHFDALLGAILLRSVAFKRLAAYWADACELSRRVCHYDSPALIRSKNHA
jgi:hypothetical protein